MSKKGDFGDILIEEVLAETANNFFGKRKIIENQIDVLQAYVKGLSEKGQEISHHLALFSYFLIEKQNVTAFFKQMGLMECDVLLKDKQPYFDLVALKSKYGLGSKKRFFNLIFFLYSEIQDRCESYNRGQIYKSDSGQSSVESKNDVNLEFIKAMVGLINDNIKRVNVEKSPSTVLQFAKSLDSGAIQKEKITGAMSSDYNQHLNSKMRIDPIDLKKLEIDKYPMLPPPEAVKSKIRHYCREFYHHHKMAVQQILREFHTFQTNKRQRVL